jgi:hypothetical protein
MAVAHPAVKTDGGGRAAKQLIKEAARLEEEKPEDLEEPELIFCGEGDEEGAYYVQHKGGQLKVAHDVRGPLKVDYREITDDKTRKKNNCKNCEGKFKRYCTFEKPSNGEDKDSFMPKKVGQCNEYRFPSPEGKYHFCETKGNLIKFFIEEIDNYNEKLAEAQEDEEGATEKGEE